MTIKGKTTLVQEMLRILDKWKTGRPVWRRELADRLVEMSLRWALTPPAKRAAILAADKRRILSWYRDQSVDAPFEPTTSDAVAERIASKTAFSRREVYAVIRLLSRTAGRRAIRMTVRRLLTSSRSGRILSRAKADLLLAAISSEARKGRQSTQNRTRARRSTTSR
jgi:hypothetical protein